MSTKNTTRFEIVAVDLGMTSLSVRSLSLRVAQEKTSENDGRKLVKREERDNTTKNGWPFPFGAKFLRSVSQVAFKLLIITSQLISSKRNYFLE